MTSIKDTALKEASFIEHLLDIGWLEGYSEIADGRHVVLWNSAAGNRLHLTTADGPLIPIAESVSGVHMSPVARGTRVAFFASDPDGNDAPGLYVHDVSTSETRGLPISGGNHVPTLSWFDDDSIIVADGTDPSRVRLLQVDVINDAPPRALVDLPAVRPMDPAPTAGPDGRILFIAATQQGQDLILLEKNGTWMPLIKGNRSAMPISARWAPDGRRIAVQVRHFEGTDLRCIDLDAGVMEMLKVPELTEPPAWSPDGRQLAVIINEWPKSRLATYDIESGDLRPTADDADANAAVSWTGHGLSFVTFGVGLPPQLIRIADPGTAPKICTPAQAVPRQPDPELLRLPQPGGFDLPALCHPAHGRTRATIVMLHGGPSAAWRVGWDPVVLSLTTAGYRVVLLETRGSTFRAWPIPPLTPGEHGIAECEDVAECVSQLTARGLIDGRALALMGHSHGAFIAYRSSLRLDRPAAVVMTSGYLHPDDLLTSKDVDVHRFHAHTFADWRDDGAEPAEFTARCPVLAVHGEHDTQVPVGTISATFGRLAGDGHMFLQLAGEGHAIRHRASVAQWLTACLSFLEKQIEERP